MSAHAYFAVFVIGAVFRRNHKGFYAFVFIVMVSEMNGNKAVMNFIRWIIYLSMFAVCSMDLIMEHRLNFMYILWNVALLYFISD